MTCRLMVFLMRTMEASEEFPRTLVPIPLEYNPGRLSTTTSYRTGPTRLASPSHAEAITDLIGVPMWSGCCVKIHPQHPSREALDWVWRAGTWGKHSEYTLLSNWGGGADCLIHSGKCNWCFIAVFHNDQESSWLLSALVQDLYLDQQRWEDPYNKDCKWWPV